MSKTELQIQKRAASAPSFTPVLTGLVQRKCACGGSPGLDGESKDYYNKRISRKRDSFSQAETESVPPIVHEVLRSPGQSLDSKTRAFMESRFGHDFSKVRIHTDAKASESARTINAKAYAIGQDVVFGAGQYSPTSFLRQKLLTHELTHTVQQSNNKGFLSIVSSSATMQHEHEANSMARDLSSNSMNSQKIKQHFRLQDTTPAVENTIQLQANDDTKIQADLDADFQFVVQKLDERHYSDADEKEVIAKLRKWALTPNPPTERSRPGSRYLEQIFMKLLSKRKDVGILTEQRLSYYSIMFNRFDLVDELRKLRDSYAPLFFGDEGTQEISLGGEFWEDVKEGRVEKRIYAYGKGVAKGVYAAGKGLLEMITHPIQTAEGMCQLVVNYDKTISGLKEIANNYVKAASDDPEKFAEMTGYLVGQIEVSLITPSKVIKGKDVAGAIKTVSTITKRAAGKPTALWHYTTEAGAAGIKAEKAIKPGMSAKGVFSTPLAPELGLSKSLAGILARAGFLGGRLDFLRWVGGKMKLFYVKPPFTHAVKFMSAEFKNLIRTNIEGWIGKIKSTLIPQFGAEGVQAIKVLLVQSIDDAVAMENILNGMGYVITSTGLVIQAIKEATTESKKE